MHSELESVVCLSVQKACDATAFESLIQRAVDSFKSVDSFKRDPGLIPWCVCMPLKRAR
jgi:hypothetical protein